MATLIKLPVPDRIAFTSYVSGDPKNLLLADFNPRERAIFNGMNANIGASYQIINELSQAKIIRAILSEREDITVLLDQVTGFDLAQKKVLLEKSALAYDFLVLAMGGLRTPKRAR